MFCRNNRKSPSLPQNDSPDQQARRKQQLADTQIKYIWSDRIPNVEGVPMSSDVPSNDKPTIAWLVKSLEIALQVVENKLLNFIDRKPGNANDELKTIKNNLQRIRKSQPGDGEKGSVATLFGESMAVASRVVLTGIASPTKELERLEKIVEDHPVDQTVSTQAGLAPYKGLFKSIKLQSIAESFQQDQSFAYYRLAGPNPMLIRCLDQIPDNFPVTEQGYQSVIGNNDSLAAALSDNRLFLLDYHEIQLLVDHPGSVDGLAKQLFAPLALFTRPDGQEHLVPVAVQRTQTPADHAIVYAETDPDAAGYWPWQTAKSIVQMAEGNYHELFVHLARTHLVIEAFVVATHRNLAKQHPVNVLLMPHFEGTLNINNEAATGLIAPGGSIEKILAAKIEFSQQAAGKDRLAFDFYANMLPADLKRRRVDDPAILPDYPYRDDALLVWNAIQQWVAEYLDIYYSDDNAVTADSELAAWADNLIDRGKIKGFKPISSKAQLVDVLTMVIFTSSAQHAAVNFPQSSVMAYAPAISGVIWGDKDPAGGDEQQWLGTLPSIKIASDQLDILHVLGSVYYRRLGYYRSNRFPYFPWFADPKVIGHGKPLQRFQQALADVEQQINTRNQSREIPYPHLLPSRIPMSINI